MTVATPDAPVSTTTRVSTRQVRDVALRTLRARGVHHASAAAAAAHVERLEVGTGTGLSCLRALLAREGPVPAGAITVDAGGAVRVPPGTSGLLLAAPLGDLLAVGPVPAGIDRVHEPWALWPVLLDHRRRTGTALALEWISADAEGRCWTGETGNVGLSGPTTGSNAPWRCRFTTAPQRGPSVDAAALADRACCARRENLGVDALAWAALTQLARDFLVHDER